MAKTDLKVIARRKRIKRIRKKVTGTTDKPRLCVFRSSRHIYAQIVDDTKGRTLVAMSSLHKEVKGEEQENKCSCARRVGMLLAEKAKAAGVEKVVFDRGGYIYHGRIKALSEGAREGGLAF